MGTRKNYNLENLRLPKFTEKLRQLVNKYGGVSKVSELTGISRQTINFWYNGERTPDAENIKKLSLSFNVSADYLLGLTDNPKPHLSISEYTGLSEKAIANLIQLNKETGGIFNKFLEELKK